MAGADDEADAPPVVDVATAAEITGLRASEFHALLRSPWLRRPGAPREGLLVSDLVLLAAAHRFGMKKPERERFLARWASDSRLEQPVSIARWRDGTVELASGDERFETITHRPRQRVAAAFFSNDEVLAGFAARHGPD